MAEVSDIQMSENFVAPPNLKRSLPHSSNDPRKQKRPTNQCSSGTSYDLPGDVNSVNKQITNYLENNQQITIPTSNTFSVLQNENTENDSTQITKEQTNEIKPPPIFLKTVFSDYKQLCNLLITSAGSESSFSCTSTIRGITIRPATSQIYRKFVSLFRELKWEFHTFQLSEEKPFRVVVRGLHPSTSHEDIKDALLTENHRVRNITNVLSKSKERLPLFFIDLEPEKNNTTIFDLRTLLYSVIKVEEPRKKRHIVQCLKCHQYQ